MKRHLKSLKLLFWGCCSAFFSMSGAVLFMSHSIFLKLCGVGQAGGALIVFACVIAEILR
jgi:hypothetical protein